MLLFRVLGGHKLFCSTITSFASKVCCRNTNNKIKEYSQPTEWDPSSRNGGKLDAQLQVHHASKVHYVYAGI